MAETQKTLGDPQPGAATQPPPPPKPEKEWSEEEWEMPEEKLQPKSELYWDQQYWEIEQQCAHYREKVTWRHWLIYYALVVAVLSVLGWYAFRVWVAMRKVWEEAGREAEELFVQWVVEPGWVEVWERNVVGRWIHFLERVEEFRDWLEKW
jgi:hypothetical protein